MRKSYCTYFLKKHNNKFITALTTSCALLVSGCSSDVARMQKYSANNYDAQKQAVLVIGTKNISFIDLTKYTKDLGKTIAVTTEAKPKVMATSKTKTTGVDTNFSADPNNVTYPKVNLRELFSPNSNSNQKHKDLSTVETTTHPAAEAINTYRILKSSRMLNVFGYATSVYSVEPGIYYISYAYNDAEGTAYYTKSAGLSSDNIVVYGAFEIKPGTVVFLGDIEIDWLQETNSAMVKIGGNIANVKNELAAAGHTDLSAKLTQAKFYPAGYKVQS